MVDGRYYTTGQAADVLGCDDETVLAWIHSGELVAVNLCKSRLGKRPTWRIAEADLGRFLLSRRNPAAMPTAPAKSAKAPAIKQYV